MTRRIRIWTSLAVAALLLAAAPAPAAAEGDGLGLTFDLGWASSYVFRGLNVFQETEQMDANMLLAPSIMWSIFDTGLTLGYWGAFQLNGDNLSANIDGALGVEQDLFLTYGMELPANLSAEFGVAAYFYPAADEGVVGTACPFFVEPSASLTWSSIVDVSLGVSYFLGIQDEAAVRDISYLYLHPSVSKSFGFTDLIGMDVSLSYGFKYFTKDGNGGKDNVHDFDLGVAVPIRPLPNFYVTPAVHASWTNLEGPGKEFADGFVVWGAVNIGVEI